MSPGRVTRPNTSATFPETREIWSYGSAYGGNALLPKKAFRASHCLGARQRRGLVGRAHVARQGHLPRRSRYNMVAAFPSACGKTNFAMMQPTLPGWSVETLGDDISWLAIGEDGRLRAINPEAGFFGVAPGTSPTRHEPRSHGDAGADTVFTNVASTPDGDVWWEGMTKEVPAGPHQLDE
jgi:phosphoenolpyruvate carboxykinase (GTP)